MSVVIKGSQWGGVKLGRFGECASQRVALKQQACSKAYWPSAILFIENAPTVLETLLENTNMPGRAKGARH